MKPTLLFIASLILLSSCTQYQYLTVSGENISKNEKNELISENDTLKVQYHFADNGKVGISIYNKSSQPLEVEWRKSAMIIDGKAYAYYNAGATIDATLQNDTLNYRGRIRPLGNPVYLASLNGSIVIKEPTQFVPPASAVYKEPLTLPLTQLENLPEATAKKDYVDVSNSIVVPYKIIYFAKDSSPVRFRSYLTLRIGGSDAQKEFTVEHNFYVSEVWKTSSGPADFPSTMVRRGDRFYL